ncbi:hypothetical protein FOVG_18757 [Fusarium oxysporum f. sp. pisi HDV247]|uniref:Uncharacterized protein n=1 Tax=Fusarium oxysporum f. sp. pisi HDV247 TaxID=1080344 RepID=W9NGB0_FUSOX|nr:hypothetical protein FOVG_18757 [Fusarium oxysporum f. sp. pisi HDV247]
MLGLPPVAYLLSTPPVQTLRQGRRPRLRGLYRPRAMRQLPRPPQRQLRRLPSTPEEGTWRFPPTDQRTEGPYPSCGR